MDESSEPVKCTEEYNFYAIITKVRKIVKMFRKSPTKNDVLQQYVKDEHNKELKLILDCKTRWSSLLDMLQRFIFLENSIKKATIDLKCMSLNEFEFDVIKDVAGILHPIKVTIEALCARDMNLFKCDAALNFMLQEIKQYQSVLSKDLFAKLVQRIKQRRTVLSDVFSFLNNPNNTNELNYDFCKAPSITSIKKELKNMILKFENKPLCELNESTEMNESSEDIEVNEAVSLKDKLNLVLKQSSSPSLNRKNYSINSALMKEIDIFINGGDRGYYLQKLYEYLSTVQPTSVEAERCFSSSGYICSKYRSRLDDKTLNALIFLRFYFKKHK